MEHIKYIELFDNKEVLIKTHNVLFQSRSEACDW
jgi:hypothetical protein